MTGANKILTVSYGTFSCTLEGFDEPFEAMRAIAEYFRDLAADDRFFGAEPPVPDAETIARIAEAKARGPVEARLRDSGVDLRLTAAASAAPAAEPPRPAPTRPEPVRFAAAEEEPLSDEVVESVAEKLKRIRAAVAESRVAPAGGAVAAATLAEPPAPEPVGDAPPAAGPAAPPGAADLSAEAGEDAADMAAEPVVAGETAEAGAAAPEIAPEIAPEVAPDFGDEIAPQAGACEATEDGAPETGGGEAGAGEALPPADVEAVADAAGPQETADAAEDAPASDEADGAEAGASRPAPEVEPAQAAAATEDDEAEAIIARIAALKAEVMAASVPPAAADEGVEDGWTDPPEADDTAGAAPDTAAEARDDWMELEEPEGGDAAAQAAQAAGTDDDAAQAEAVAATAQAQEAPSDAAADDAALTVTAGDAWDEDPQTPDSRGRAEEAVEEPALPVVETAAETRPAYAERAKDATRAADRDDAGDETDAIAAEEADADQPVAAAGTDAAEHRAEDDAGKTVDETVDETMDEAGAPDRDGREGLPASAEDVLPEPVLFDATPVRPMSLLQRARARFFGGLGRSTAIPAAPEPLPTLVLDAQGAAEPEAMDAATLRIAAEAAVAIAAAEDRAARAAGESAAPGAGPGAGNEDDGHGPAAAALAAAPSPFARRDAEADMDRIADKTRSEMEGSESRRRQSAISHLKAAVAATEADRKRGGALPPAPPPASDAAFRDDLSQAIRPRRPVLTGDTGPDRPGGDEPRPDPLVLGQAQRIDRLLPADAVQPRRLTTRNLLRDDYDPEEEDFDDTTPSTAEAMEASRNFADFAERMGANNLPELLEAAAAYTSAVEGHAWFSRPQILQKVARIADEGDFTREESLRSFGMLLRQGKIQKIRRGQFVIASTSKFMAEARRAQM